MTFKTRTREQALKLWVKALRSGEYKQTRKTLKGRPTFGDRTGTGFCCLGVVCDLAAKDGGAQWEPSPYGVGKKFYMGEDGNLPRAIGDFLGIQPWVSELVDLNDDKKASFKEIADYIEKNIIPKVRAA